MIETSHDLPGVPGAVNFRDLGGLRIDAGVIRPGRLMRAGELSSLGPAGRAALAELDLHTVIDLRQPREREQHPDDLDGLRITVLERPLLAELPEDRPRDLFDLYRAMIDGRGEALANVVKDLAVPGALPALLHCMAGKDRTGLVTALILGSFDASDEVIVSDYHFSEREIQGETWKRLREHARSAGMSEQVLAVGRGAPRTLIERVMAYLREHHGGPAEYLRSHGATDEELGALRAALI
ncbi:MAG TPA: tyrosine-protein phosphatase [Solirubrobacteraceae bacterium]|jgi:protein-tyrosine phosphatase|nr:tyrosine-protein phosphatase [Solirubrobacteraceae bacterium]